MIGQCLYCLFWEDVTGGQKIHGYCRRYPPIGGEHNFTESGRPRIPVTRGNDWCGEFKALTKEHLMDCRKCGGEMKEGIATGQTFVGGLPDFPGESHAITFSAGGPGKVIKCSKCVDCGWSVTTAEQDDGD